MRFSELRKEYVEYEEACAHAKKTGILPSPFYVENKQRLNLSSNAYAILLHDADAFHDRLNIKPGSGEIGSTIINYLFRCYRANANASIYHSCSRLSDELASTLINIDKEILDTLTTCMTEKHRKKLQAEVKMNLSEKEHAKKFSIRIDTENLAFLGSSNYWGWKESEAYQDKIGLYIRAVIEEYAQKSYLEREAIFCRHDLETIREALKSGRMLKIVTRNKFVQYVKPYQLQSDSGYLYHYLAGYVCSSPNGSWKIQSLRLSSITECTILHHDGILSPEEKETIKSEIRNKGIQFISDESSSEKTMRIVVKFTPEGQRMYHQMLHLRPMYVQPPEGFIYTFNTTLTQAVNYFFKFGHHVKILEPQGLADLFLRKYESASRQYK